MSRLTVIMPVSFLVACTQAAEERFQVFADCWEFEQMSEGIFRTEFTAMIYPKSGVIAYNRKCPSYRLSMSFQNIGSTIENSVFGAAEEYEPVPTGLSGVALVRIDPNQDDIRTLRVKVEQLSSATVLSEKQTQRLQEEMNIVR